MKYVTHALCPALALSGRTVRRVTARGTGRLLSADRADISATRPRQETGLFELRDGTLLGEATVLTNCTPETTAHSYRPS